MMGSSWPCWSSSRQDRVRVEQSEQFGSIDVHLIDATPITTVMETAGALCLQGNG